MPGPSQQSAFVTWKVDGFPAIVCSQGALNKLAQQTLQSAGQNGKGEETGGVLFGRIEGREMRVTASRPVPCEHASGPEYILSDNDEVALQYQLRAFRDEAALRDLEPVGWYRTRIAGGIYLSPDDVALWNRYFARSQQVVLVLQPQDDAVRAGFFFRPKSGPPRTDQSLLEFRVDDGVSLIPQTPRIEPEPPPAPALQQQPAQPPPPEALFERPPATSNWKVWTGIAVAVLALIGAGAWWLLQPPQPSPEISFKLTEQNGQLRALWDATAPVFTGAKAGTLTVQDGTNQVSTPINEATLRNGVIPIVRTSGDVKVRIEFKSLSGDTVLAAARFLAPPRQDTVTLPPDHPKVLELAKIKTQQDDAVKERLDWQTKSDLLAVRLADTLAAAAAPKPVVEPPPTVVATAAPTPATTTAPPAPVVTAAAPQAQPEPARPSYSGPTSGRFLWTGFLAPNATLSIDGRRASTGRVNMALPGVPVRISVHPAEVTASGLSVYSSTQRRPVEPKSVQTEWMDIQNVQDATRARDVQVVQSPTETNRNQGIQIRAGQRSVTALVIEWELDR